MIVGARKLPAHHITIRVPWHDHGWDGTVCKERRANTHCLILPRIGTAKKDDTEVACATQRLDEVNKTECSPCIDERVSFMAPLEMMRKRVRRLMGISTKRHSVYSRIPPRASRFDGCCAVK